VAFEMASIGDDLPAASPEPVSPFGDVFCQNSPLPADMPLGYSKSQLRVRRVSAQPTSPQPPVSVVFPDTPQARTTKSLDILILTPPGNPPASPTSASCTSPDFDPLIDVF
jgi:hypothetical protein